MATNPDSQANRLSKQPSDQKIWQGFLPKVNFQSHRAYQGMRISLSMRLRAAFMFAKGLFLVLIRYLTDFEHLPKRPDDISRMQWVIKYGIKLLWLIIKQKLGRLIGAKVTTGDNQTARQVLVQLQSHGVYSFALSTQQQQKMAELIAPFFTQIENRFDTLGLNQNPAKAKFDDIRLWLDPAKHSRVFAWFNQLMQDKGVCLASSAYLNRKVHVAHITPQINIAGLPFSVNNFADLDMADSQTNYMHVDTAYNVTKMMIFFGDVDQSNGPFSFVCGSHQAKNGFVDRLIRRANDYAGLAGRDPQTRALFMSLPKCLQRKNSIGSDLTDDDEQSADLLSAERVFYTPDSHCVLFDPSGIHRGGIVNQGKRYSLSILLAESF